MKTFSTCLLPLLSLLLALTGSEGAVPKQADTRPLHSAGLPASEGQGIRAAYEAARHRFLPVADGWQAHNPGQHWTTHFDGQGFTAKPQEGAWTWGLQFQSYGFGEAQTTVSGTPAVKADGQRLSYQWDDNVEEWFINDQRGLEHGFIVARRPAAGNTPAASGLSFTLLTRGGLSPRVAPQAVAFHDATGEFVLNYSGLKVWDADGVILPSRFEAAEGNSFRLVVDEQGARYPITIDPIAQHAYIKASNTAADDQFGYAVAISGDTMVIGAPYEDSGATGVNGNQADESKTAAGAVYVFVRNSGVWTQQAYLKASNSDSDDQFGCAVAISGDTIVVGAMFEDGSATGVNGDQANNLRSDSGAAYVFTRNAGVWSQQAYLKASISETDASFGGAVAIADDTIVVGASRSGLLDNGAVYVFTRTSGTWSQQARFRASNSGANDLFGCSVAISEETILIGAYNEASASTGVGGDQSNNSVAGAGAAYVFTRSGGVWSQQAYLKGQEINADDNFGWAVALSGDTALVSAYRQYLDDSGAVHVFTRNGGVWSKTAFLRASNADFGDQFGYSLALLGDTAVIGAIGEDSSATGEGGNQADYFQPNSGAAYVFVREAGGWIQRSYLKASNTGEGDIFGSAIAISGRTVVVSSKWEDGMTTGVGGDQGNESAWNSGAAYAFTLYLTVNPSTANHSFPGNPLTISGSNFSPIPGENTVAFSPTGTGIVTASTVSSLTISGITGVSPGPLSVVVSSGGLSSGAPVQVATIIANSAPSDIIPVNLGVPPAATPIVWAPVTNFGDSPSEVSNAGTHHAAVRFGNTDLVVNGVTFSRHIENGTFANGSLITTNAATVASGGTGGTGTYGQLVSSAGFHTSTAAGEIRINGLTTGALYQVQLFMPYWDNLWPTQFASSGGTPVILRCGATGNPNPEMVTGTFRASGSQQVISWLPQSTFAMLAAVSVRTLEYPLTVMENNPPGIAVGELLAVDADVEQTHTFSLVPGDGDQDNGSFTIVGNTLKLTPVADFETKPSYSLRVQAQDTGGAVFSKSVTVTVMDTPDFVEIAVEQPAATSLTSGSANVLLGARPVGNASPGKVFTIRNLGTNPLTLGVPTVSDGNAGDFSVNHSGLLLSVPPSGQTTFSVTFIPGGGGSRSATLSITSNDPDESPFTLTLSGTGLVATNDTDGDGLNDLAEFNFSPMGFDWQTSQPALVAALNNGAATANLYSPQQLRDQHPGAPLLFKDPASGQFNLTLALEKSAVLESASFQPFPFVTENLHVNDLGGLEFNFSPPEPPVFFRVQTW